MTGYSREVEAAVPRASYELALSELAGTVESLDECRTLTARTVGEGFAALAASIARIREAYRLANAVRAVTAQLALRLGEPMPAEIPDMLGFADGGWVPGSPGEPQLAIVHGGEFVLSRDMLASMRASGGIAAVPAVAPTAYTTPGPTAPGYVPIVVNLGGTQMAAIHAQLIPVAQQMKNRTGVTGLA